MGEVTPVDQAYFDLCNLVRADQQREIAARIRRRARDRYDVGDDNAGHWLALCAEMLEDELA